MRDTKVVRNVTVIDIEGTLYEDVEVTMKSISADYFIFDKDRVKVTIRDKDGKKVWKKTFYNAFMLPIIAFVAVILVDRSPSTADKASIQPSQVLSIAISE